MRNTLAHLLTSVSILLLTLAAAMPARSQTNHLAFAGAREDYQYPGAYAVADFNGDGFPDIATSSPGNQIIILLNDGTGHFTQQSASIPGNQGQYFIAGDFNNDGLVDVAFSGGGAIYIALGAGNGTLRNVSSIGANGSGDLKAADMNGDGKLDIVAGGYSVVNVFLGNGDGTLKAPITIGNVQSPFTIADVNGDGKPDIVGENGHTVAVFFNSGSASFTAGPVVSLGNQYAEAIASGDLNADGNQDLVISELQPNTLDVYTGDGTGNFALVSSSALAFEADDVVLLDSNGDGKLDVFYDKTSSSHPPATNLNLQLGNGDATFGPASVYATAGANNRILLVDTRKSGHLDLLTGGGNQISILPNKGNNTYTQGSFFTLAGVLQSTVSGDFNHDGIRDLVVGVRLSTSSPSEIGPDTNSQFAGAYVLLGTGTPSAAFTTGQRLFVPPDVLALTTADLNKDGNQDLIFLTGQDIVIYMGKGDGTFTIGAQYACTCSALTVGDFNGDGHPDIATNGVYIYLGKGDGTFNTPSFTFAASGNYIGAADINADGKADLIVGVTNSQSGFVAALGNGDGTFGTLTPFGSAGLGSAIIADLNGDGTPDFAYLTNYGISIYLNTAGVFTATNSISTSQNIKSDTIATADFNNDGHLDLVAPGLNMSVYAGNGDGTFAPAMTFGSANYPNVIVAADFYDFGSGKLPDIIGVGQNGAISTLYDQSKQ